MNIYFQELSHKTNDLMKLLKEDEQLCHMLCDLINFKKINYWDTVNHIENKKNWKTMTKNEKLKFLDDDLNMYMMSNSHLKN